MSARLCQHGYEVIAYDRDQEALAAHCSAIGATRAQALGEVASAQTIVTMLPSSSSTSEAIEALLPQVQEGTTIIDMGSSAPAETVRLAALLVQRGVAMIDAPVSGGVAGAQAGTLTVMVGGSSEQLERHRELLERLGGRIVATGDVGSGHAMKALNNLLSAVGVLASCEVLQIGRRFGLDPRTMLDVLNSSSGRNFATETKLERYVLSDSFDSGFSLELMLKDVRTALELASQTGAPTPLGRDCAKHWESANRALRPGADHTEIARWLQLLVSG